MDEGGFLGQLARLSFDFKQFKCVNPVDPVLKCSHSRTEQVMHESAWLYRAFSFKYSRCYLLRPAFASLSLQLQRPNPGFHRWVHCHVGEQPRLIQ